MAPPVRHRAALVLGSTALVLLATAAGLAAQSSGSIHGRVTDAVTGRALAGAQVYVKGTRLGALAGSDGGYIIRDVPTGAQVVRVEDLGFKPVEQTVPVATAAAAAADFALSQEAIALDEMVVTGTAGATARRVVGNTVSTVQASQITAVAPVENVQQMLTARAPGVVLMSNAGTIGASSRVRIRGAGTLNANTSPVVYVDGVRVLSGTQDGYNTSGGLVQGTSALDAINPNDIQSIEVIKGPAAATLYGADAAGGVIQIITKKGRTGGEGVHWDASLEQGNVDWTVSHPTNFTWCGAPQVVASPGNYPGCANVPASTILQQDPLLHDPSGHGSSLRTGGQQDLNLSARGGGANYNFYISGEHNFEDGVFVNNYSHRNTARANFGFVPSEKLNFQVNMAYAQQHLQLPLNDNASNGILRNAYRGQPGATAPWSAGWRGLPSWIGNTYDNETREERTTLGLTANYQPVSWWKSHLTFGMDKNDRVNQEIFAIDTTGRAPFGGDAAKGEVNQFMPMEHFWSVDAGSSVSRTLSAAFSDEISAGLQYNKRQYHEREVNGIGFVANQLNLISSAAITRAGETVTEQSSLGIFLQDMVGWRDRLYATGAVRVDNNSAFGDQVNLVVYPKASLSYVISDESFFHIPAVDQLKLRAAWGRAGRAPNPFSADRTWSGQVATTFGDVSVNQLEPSAYGNPDLKAETGDEIEAGFESSLLQNRLGIDFTYYHQRTLNALMAIPDPRSAGFTASHLTNVGEIANQGVELALTATPIYTRLLQWDANVSFATNANKLVRFGTGQSEIFFGAFANVQKMKEGYPLGGFWATDVVRDASGKPVLNSSGGVQVSSTQTYVGPSIPTRQIGLANTVTVLGNLKLFANLDYQGGHYQWCAICSIRTRIDRNTQQINDPNLDPVQYKVLTSLQTRTWIMPADFIKLRELSVTYMIPGRYLRGAGVSGASLSLGARNLWMWTRYKGTGDPEANFYSVAQSATSGGDYTSIDYDSVPMLRRLTATLRLSF